MRCAVWAVPVVRAPSRALLPLQMWRVFCLQHPSASLSLQRAMPHICRADARRTVAGALTPGQLPADREQQPQPQRPLKAAMLKTLHSHIFASKLRDVFTQSPLVLVYQTIGSVDVASASAKLQAKLDAQLPDAGLRVRMCRMSNMVATGAGEPALERMFQASNLLVGFGAESQGQQRQPQKASAAADSSSSAGEASTSTAQHQPDTEARAGRRDGLQQLLGSLFSSDQQQQRGKQQQLLQLPHQQLAKAFQLGTALPGEQPLVLVGAFYGRRSIRLGHLKQWVALDEGKVYSEMLAAIEGPLQALLNLESPAEQLAATLDAAGPQDLVACLEMRAAANPQGDAAAL